MAAAPFAHAQYQEGTSFTAVADPPVPRPSTTPCVVNLFTNDEFDNFNNMPFNFTPPANCPGPYAKIVLTGDYYITGGVQYDRTSQVFLNNVNIYFGTTPEPVYADQNDPWHFETDVTDYASLFSTTGTGFASLGNIVNSTYTGDIFGTMNVLFYPVSQQNPKSQPPADVVVPLMASEGGVVYLNSGTPSVSTTVTLPTNLDKLYMDVVAQSQNAEEQWFTCLPADADYLSIDGCPNTAFREVEVTIDGVPAGVAPVSPWIFTGGLDPYLWFPIPGAQTLNFKPYRVDLSPFAGVVSDGQPHSIGIELYNAYEYFTVTAALLGYEDAGSTHTSGSIVSNTLSEPNPDTQENLNQDQYGDIYGNIVTSSNRAYAISGTVKTSHGTLTNSVSANIAFSNNSYLYDGEVSYEQYLQQTSSINTTSSVAGDGPTQYSSSQWIFPIVLDLYEVVNDDGSIDQITTSNQNWGLTESPFSAGGGFFPGPVAQPVSSAATNSMYATDDLIIVPCDGGYCIGGNADNYSSQFYSASDSTGYCYYQGIVAQGNVLAADYEDPSCASEYSGNLVGGPAHLRSGPLGSKSGQKPLTYTKAKPILDRLAGPIGAKAEARKVETPKAKPATDARTFSAK
jgi:hypothetical protein